nr:copper chaperone PCu(A)C [Mangrovactinospora gilvigrisea]
MPKPAAGGMAAAYLTVANSGGTTDRLTRVTSQDATTVTMDTTSGGSMQEVTGFNVPAGGTLALARGGNHLMLQGLKKPLKEGGSITLRLTFAQSGPRTVTVPVESMTYRPGSAG